VSFARVPAAALREAGAEMAGRMRPRQDGAIAFFGTRYRTIRPFAPACYVNLQEKKKTLPLSGTLHRFMYF
jgi:hypothetical protein